MRSTPRAKPYDKQAAAMVVKGETPWPYKTWVSIMTWQRYASPVWTDIRQSRTLQYRSARDEKDEAHISPLQLDVIERCIAALEQSMGDRADAVHGHRLGGVLRARGEPPRCGL